jgi:uncharacterized protein (DUF2384 family)
MVHPWEGKVPSIVNRRGGGAETRVRNGSGKGRAAQAERWKRVLGGPGTTYDREECMTREEYAARAQRMLWGLVGVLQEVEDVLDFLASTMPESPENMLEYRTPYDVMMEVEGDLRCSLNDDLRPMIARLKRAAVVSQGELERHWEEAQKQRTS